MEGYDRIGKLMGRQDECAMYRRFRKLNAMNLLYLQAELTQLEHDLEELAERDKATDDRQTYCKDWWSLSQNDEDEEDSEQWEKVLEIRVKLEQYNDSLCKQAKISRLGSPSSHDLAFLREWLVRPGMGDYPLIGLDRESYCQRYEKDLVAIKARPAPDLFSRWFNYSLFPTWHRLVSRRFKKPADVEAGVGHGVYEYDDTLLAATARIIITVVASMLPVCSVIIQYFVHGNLFRLSLIVLASALFALALALMTNSRMIEVFAATSAPAIVELEICSNNQTSTLRGDHSHSSRHIT
ncbi:hypothetical protein F5Y15DRAFT_266404 [Xylariaceae sp. FL0016]|nr:hypothetical protein F5Y15DRAFT_266404 [Xylariaceae sp. FL0016]